MSKCLKFRAKDVIDIKALEEYISEEELNVVIEGSDEYATFYIPDISTRAISLELDGRTYYLEINILSCNEDYKLFRLLALYFLQNGKVKAELDNEKTDAKKIAEIFSDDNIPHLIESDANVVLSILRLEIKKNGGCDMVIYGPKREYCIGPWVMEKLQVTENTSGFDFAQMLFSEIRHVQYGLPENVRKDQSYYKFKNREDKRIIEVGTYLWNKRDITAPCDFIMLRNEDFIDDDERVIIPIKDFIRLAPNSWKRLDDRQFLTKDMTEDEYKDLWKRAKECSTKELLPRNSYKVHVVGVKSDQKLYSLLCKELERNGYSVYPSSESIGCNAVSAKESMKSVEDCDFAVLMKTRNTGRSKQYQKEVIGLMSTSKPFVTITIDDEDVISKNGIPFQSDMFTQNDTLAIKFADLLDDINEMRDWVDFYVNNSFSYEKLSLSDEEHNRAVELFNEAREAKDNGNIQKAFDLYKESADMGLPESMILLAILIHNNYEETEELNVMQFNLMSRAADFGYIPALNTIGLHYRDGIGCKKNIRRSIEFYKQAMNSDSDCGGCNLSDIYDTGDGVKRNLGKALFWISQAYALDPEDESYKNDYERLLKELMSE